MKMKLINTDVAVAGAAASVASVASVASAASDETIVKTLVKLKASAEAAEEAFPQQQHLCQFHVHFCIFTMIWFWFQ